MTISATPEQIAWAAGLFEGEGCISHNRHGKPKLAMEMTDLDVLERFARVVGFGQARPKGRADRPAHYRPIFYWQATARAEVRLILAMLLPQLGNRRAYKALNALDDIELN